MLQEYLPNTTKFSIDNNAQSNSSGYFYDCEIRFLEDGKFKMLKLGGELDIYQE